MKKFLQFATAVFLVSIITPHAHAQSSQDTINWLNAKLPPVVNARYYRPVTGGASLRVDLVEQHSGLVQAYMSIPFASLTSIGLTSCDDDGSHHPFCITFSGPNQGCSYNGQCQDNQAYTLDLETSDQALATSLINALKHMAQLNGAPMVKDNLF